MAKSYLMRFGSGDPRTYTGLSPTFLIFVNMTNGATLAPPAIAESLTGSGLYQFSYGVTQPIAFLADAATTSPGAAGRYVNGQIDPADRSDEYGNSLMAFGTTLVAIGTTNFSLGTTGVALGTSNVALGTSNFAFGASNFALGVSNFALGTSILAIGNTILAIAGTGGTLSVLIGSTASAIGDSATDPSTLFGYLKRIAELEQGREQFVKSSGALSMYDRTGATLLASRTISNSASMVVKS